MPKKCHALFEWPLIFKRIFLPLLFVKLKETCALLGRDGPLVVDVALLVGQDGRLHLEVLVQDVVTFKRKLGGVIAEAPPRKKNIVKKIFT